MLIMKIRKGDFVKIKKTKEVYDTGIDKKYNLDEEFEVKGTTKAGWIALYSKDKTRFMIFTKDDLYIPLSKQLSYLKDRVLLIFNKQKDLRWKY